MSSETPTVFVSMAIGTQGGAVARQLRDLEWNVRGTARDIHHHNTKVLQVLGVHLMPGDWDDEDFLPNLLDFEAAPRRAQRTVSLARVAGVTQAISTTTLGTAMLDEGNEPPIPPTPLFAQHFASKRRVEKAVEIHRSESQR